ncbi:MAG: NAD(P)H-hydrate dehydratase [Pseudomonadota bacterium]|nr:NAD(P)H-hydrate dehydratase [Pseudomonadota bacterium]|tara:strand:- start:5 stop:898 length:894 start_codon:yes stop_codon:yes gene_type:complete
MSHKIFCESLEDHVLKISLDKGSDLNLLAEIIVAEDINTYKKSYGKTLIVGGADGYLGAVLISGFAALRSGSRYVEVFSTDTNHSLIPLHRPELMTSYDIKKLDHKFNTYKNLLLGPGISNNEWSRETFSIFKNFCQNKNTDKNIVIDAGFLSLLAVDQFSYDKWVLTPHIGEAAQLLNTSTKHIQDNRLDSAKEIQKIYGGIIILKGHNTIIQTHDNSYICTHGNNSMGTAGMGDCLAGTLISLMSLVNAKDYNNAILYAVALHSMAADNILANKGKFGILANDVIVEINNLLNNN